MTQTRMSDSTPELNLEGGEDQRIHTLILLRLSAAFTRP